MGPFYSGVLLTKVSEFWISNYNDEAVEVSHIYINRRWSLVFNRPTHDFVYFFTTADGVVNQVHGDWFESKFTAVGQI